MEPDKETVCVPSGFVESFFQSSSIFPFAAAVLTSFEMVT